MDKETLDDNSSDIVHRRPASPYASPYSIQLVLVILQGRLA